MKARTDFVTNSSSSSFILALHKDARRKDVEEELRKQRSEIENILNYMGAEPEESEDIIEEIADALFFNHGELELGDWRITARSFSNEGDTADAVIYEGIRIDSDLIKVKMGDY